MWFRWEFSQEWEPVVYRGGKPPADPSIRSTEFVAVPADCIGEDGEPMFWRLRERFPMEGGG